jgi:4-amino-4-deoxy-L-arabinose transferase-like glycosyltransferase
VNQGSGDLATSLRDPGFLAVLSAAALLRLYLAVTSPFFWDEAMVLVPLAETISFSPDTLNLPLRGKNHPAMAAYWIKASTTLFGTSELGVRALHLLAGISMIVLVYLVARRWYGRSAGLWAAALLAFNEYHLRISSLASSHAPHLLFITLAIFAFSRFLDSGRSRHLYGAAAATALAFYCKEHSALLLPVLLLSVVQTDFRKWLRSAPVYVAAGLFFLLISPDLYWNLTTTSGGAQRTYADHLARIGGVGLSPYPLVFFFGKTFGEASGGWFGARFHDPLEEYNTMNPGSGLVLLGAVCAVVLSKRGTGAMRSFLLAAFGVLFGFFFLIRPGFNAEMDDAYMVPVSWSWVDMTLPVTAILGGLFLGAESSHWARAARWFAVGTFVYAVAWILAVYDPAAATSVGQ